MISDHKQPGVAFWITVALAVALVLLSAYSGSYILIVEPTHPMRYYPLVGARRWSSEPRYHAIGQQDFWRRFFGPANSLDRRIRPKTWAIE